MDDNPQTHFNETFEDLTRRVANLDVASDDFSLAAKNLKTFSEVSVPKPPKPASDPEPTTLWGKTKALTNKIWESETTRVTIKALGALGGVGVVTWATVHRDHVYERQAIDQARQRPIQ